MHPYAEYLQEYVYQKHDLQDGGKFKDDFRISTVGRIMRRLWIDELPSLINLFKGDLKVVGVRPLSRHYFSLYTKDLQEKRIKYRPGLVPPFYVDNPKTLDEIMASENKYLDAYAKHPLWNDIKYLFVAAYNIIFKRYRSG
jgi:lipopolysaccharide/colanic/teichoic acid biosynthesis glycosyltransferase